MSLSQLQLQNETLRQDLAHNLNLIKDRDAQLIKYAEVVDVLQRRLKEKDDEITTMRMQLRSNVPMDRHHVGHKEELKELEQLRESLLADYRAKCAGVVSEVKKAEAAVAQQSTQAAVEMRRLKAKAKEKSNAMRVLQDDLEEARRQEAAARSEADTWKKLAAATKDSLDMAITAKPAPPPKKPRAPKEPPCEVVNTTRGIALRERDAAIREVASLRAELRALKTTSTTARQDRIRMEKHVSSVETEARDMLRHCASLMGGLVLVLRLGAAYVVSATRGAEQVVKTITHDKATLDAFLNLQVVQKAVRGVARELGKLHARLPPSSDGPPPPGMAPLLTEAQKDAIASEIERVMNATNERHYMIPTPGTLDKAAEILVREREASAEATVFRTEAERLRKLLASNHINPDNGLEFPPRALQDPLLLEGGPGSYLPSSMDVDVIHKLPLHEFTKATQAVAATALQGETAQQRLHAARNPDQPMVARPLTRDSTTEDIKNAIDDMNGVLSNAVALSANLTNAFVAGTDAPRIAPAGVPRYGVAAALAAAGARLEDRSRTDDGLVDVPCAVRLPSGDRVVVRALGEEEYSLNGDRDELCGPALVQEVLLKARGWRVVTVSYKQWASLSTPHERTAMLRELLHL